MDAGRFGSLGQFCRSRSNQRVDLTGSGAPRPFGEISLHPLGNSPYCEDRSLSRRQVDRKSTRLNSSHITISYAVFCLKKKNLSTQAVLALRAHKEDYACPLDAQVSLLCC